MTRSLSVSLFMWMLVFVCAAPLHADTLKAGVAKADITPPLGLPMYGYGGRTTSAQGILDPLYARVLALEAGATRVALVTLDLGHAFGQSETDQIREAVRKSSRVSYVLIVASHTHAGPAMSGDSSSKLVSDWEKVAVGKIVKAIDEAYRQVIPVLLGTGYGETYIGHNRLYGLRTGTPISFDAPPNIPFERNPTKVPTSPFDPTVGVLRVDTLDGKPLAILVNYACHSVALGSDNLQYSADYPGVMVKTVERAFDNAALCFFLQGAAGDINPYFAVTPIQQDGVKLRDWTGQHLGEEAIRVAKEIKTRATPKASLDFSEDILPLRSRWNHEKIGRLLRSPEGQNMDPLETAVLKQEEFRLPAATVLINKRIALMGMPGEPFVEFQMNWRNRCPVPEAFFLGYANADFGYLPTIVAATRGGYGAASDSTQMQVGAGERMVDNAVVRTYEMLGLLNDMPENMREPK